MAFAVHNWLDMKRSLTASAIVFAITALVGTALNARANAKGVEPQTVNAVYWAQ